jgi:hypothetical protein
MSEIERTLLSSDGVWKVELFRRPDGTFGRRALCWSKEHNRWLGVGQFSGGVTSSLDAAELEARAGVPQMGRTARVLPVSGT